jgi:hypothetical protein
MAEGATMPVLELTDEQVIALVQQLTEEQKKRLLSLLERGTARRPIRKFGIAQNAILSMADDFDAPLDEFKEYM